MAQLSADISRTYKTAYDKRNELPVKASTTIYAGSAVGHSSGLARQLVAGDTFCGFANAKAANVARTDMPGLTINGTALGSDGAINVDLRAEGIVEVSTISGASGVGDVGTAVYMSDGNTFTTTSTSNSRVGTIAYYLNSKFGVAFQSPLVKGG